MKMRSAAILTAMGTLAILAAVLVLRPFSPSWNRLRGKTDLNVIILTLDTLRADRLGCYGYSGVETPAIDRFAADGVRFDRCIAPTPLTLPSHTSIMTGTLPLYHGVRDNGGFIVPPQLRTLAECFRDAGFATGAFIAAYVLDSKWGLARGFDTYFDKFDLSRFEKISLASVQRRADEVMDEALPWLEKARSGKFFAWIHLYDPHTPYDPPPPFDRTYAGRPYLGEIAYMDTQIARLRDFLEAEGLLEKTIVVLAGDHGESLGAHEEATHGFFVYQEALHVPFIVATPYEKTRGVVSGRVVSLTDIMPTILNLAGLPAPAGMQGTDLTPLFFAPEKALAGTGRAYAETYYPRYHYGWSDLKSFQTERHKIILAPTIELYDLEADPFEERNLAATDIKTLAALRDEALPYIEAAGRGALSADLSRVDEETRQALAALGYVGSFTDSSRLEGRALANPRDKIGVFNALSRAREMGMEGDAAAAADIVLGIIGTDPDITDAWFTLGNIRFRTGEYERAIEAFERALALKPDDAFTVINIANSFQRLGRPGEAEDFILEYLGRGFQDAQLYHLLGGLMVTQRKYDEAVGYYDKSLELNPQSASSHNSLAAIAILRDELDRAEDHLRKGLEINPKLLNIHYNLAQLREKRGDEAGAEEAYLRELEYSPRSFRASFNLARLYRRMGREADERRFLETTLASNPDFPLTYFYLARLELNRGADYARGVELVRKGFDLKPGPEDEPLGYFLLADLYGRLGDPRQAEENARRGRAAAEKLKSGSI